MATLEQSVQSLIDQIYSGTLAPAEAALVAASINELSQHQNFQQALLAVAEGDLNTAVANLEAAKATLNASSDVNTQSLNAATTLLNQELQKLDVIPDIREEQTRQNNELQRNVIIEGIVGYQSNSGNGRRSHATYAIYDANSKDTYAFMPSYSHNTAPSTDNYAAYWYRHLADGNHVQLGRWFVDSNSHHASASPSYFYSLQAFANVPLASRGDASDIQYSLVLEEQTAANEDSVYYGGVRVYGRDFSERAKPKTGVVVKDRYGFQTSISGTYPDGSTKVLYSNDKNCVLVLRDDNELVELYHDGIVETEIKFLDNAALQSYVDAHDIIVLPFIRALVSSHPHFQLGAFYSSSTSLPSKQDSYGGQCAVHFLFEYGKLIPLQMRQNVKWVYGQFSSNYGNLQGALQSHFSLQRMDATPVVSCDCELSGYPSGTGFSHPVNYDTVVLTANPYGGQVLGTMEQLYYTNSNYYYGLWKGRFK
ncbi:hypothetical protein [Alteromonas sp. a30]|uniref:hypothetical protein n=1 Tax=Alteromonas sp. a30 TaxID=2730917 RepID=UPI0022801AC2|nr:hypothetical protein [Alteromonas sp. a30]MCY7295097.1 hypothetical protein [Alteromonas sp. a30]